MSRKLKSILLASTLVATGLLSAACDEDTTGPDDNTIVIGGLFSLTGNWATLGVASKAAMEIGIEDVNQYLAAGNTGLQFSASIQDTKLDPPTALTQVTAMKAAGVEVVIGPQSSSEVAAIKSYVDANGVLVISQSSTAGTLAVANDNIFRLTPSDALEATAIVCTGATDWLWMSMMRARRAADAQAMLARRPDSVAAGNAYTRRLKLYRGEIQPDEVMTPADTADVQVATLSYGVGNWYLLRGDTTRAREWFQRSVHSGGWPGFGFILSEIELRRLR